MFPKRKLRHLLIFCMIALFWFISMKFYFKTSPFKLIMRLRSVNFKAPNFEELSKKYEVFDIQKGMPKSNDLKVKRDQVKSMMLHAWNGYKKFAWGANELSPISKRPNLDPAVKVEAGETIIDSLDTLYIMGLNEEFKEGQEWVRKKFNMDSFSVFVSVMEVNIRFIGGLLSAYFLSGDQMFIYKAKEVADLLLPAFDTPTGIPYSTVNLATGEGKDYPWAVDAVLAEMGTLHLEFCTLSDLTGDPVYKNKVLKIRKTLRNMEKIDGGLYNNYVNVKTGEIGVFRSISVGGMGDSFYEYLLKSWLLSGKRDNEALDMYTNAIEAIDKHLVKKSTEGWVYIGERKMNKLQVEEKMGHLTCFAGGMIALGANVTNNSTHFRHLAEELARTCHESYQRSPTKLGPEIFQFKAGQEVKSISEPKYYMLRPEVVETYFILWRTTKQKKYRDWGWEVVLALEKHCKVKDGYSGLKDVYQTNPLQYDDVQQSFYLAETLKYLYLLFSEDEIFDLNSWVFNTEAHPIPIYLANG